MIGLVVVTAALLVAPPPKASAKKSSSWVVLIQAKDLPTWRDALQSAAEDAKEKTWVPPPAVTLEEAQLALGCSGWSDGCAGQIAAMAGANMAFVVDVTARGDGALVEVRAVKAGGDKQGPLEKLELPGRGASDLETAQDFVRGVAKGQKPTLIFVDSDLPGTDVWFDGVLVGKVPWRSRASAGEHKLELRHEGKAPLTKMLNLKAGSVTNEIISMNAQGPAVDIKPTVGVTTPEPSNVDVVEVPAAEGPPPPASSVPPMTTLGYSLGGVGVAVTALGGIFLGGSLYDTYNRVDCGEPPEKTCLPAAVLFGLYQKGERAEFLDAVKDENGVDTGQRTGSYAAWIAGSAAAVGIGALLIGTSAVILTGDAPTEETAAPAAAGGSEPLASASSTAPGG